MSWSRREFAELLGAVAAVTLPGCSREPADAAPRTGTGDAPAPATTPTPTPDPASTRRSARHEFLERLRHAVRTSPDHRTAQSEAIVASRDALRAVRFVREQIVVLPAPDAISRGWWGPRGSLRSGSGSLRDRAELIAAMLRAMGLPATVKDMARPEALTRDAIFALRDSPSFAPDRRAIDASFAQRGLPAPPVEAYAADARTVRDIDSIARSLLAQIPADKRVARITAVVELPARIPVVEFLEDGRRAVAVALGGIDVLEVAADALATAGAVVYPRVEVAVLAAFRPPVGSVVDRDKTMELLRESWTAEQLCGRRLTLAFVAPDGGLRQSTQRWAHPVRRPVLKLTDPRGLEPQVRPGGIGQWLTLFGGAFTAPPDAAGSMAAAAGDAAATAVGPYGPLLLAARPRDLAREAQSLDVQVDASSFPDIRLSVALRNARGEPIDGLGAADFVVEEDGVAEAACLLGNQAPARPRVLVLSDGSGSTTEFFPTQVARREFDRSIAEALVEAARRTPFDAQVVTMDGLPRAGAWEPPDAQKLAAALPLPSTSDGWIGLGRGLPAARAAVAILISDSQMTDDPARIPALRAQLAAAGTPVIVVPIGRGGERTAADIVALTGGEVIRHDDPALTTTIASAVARHVTARPPASYEVRYRSRNLDAKLATRKVNVSLAAKRAVLARTAYTLPAQSERTLPGGLAGLYLQFSIDGETEVRRLGGVDVNYAGVPDPDRVGAAAMREAEDAAFGITTVAFEPDAPAASEMLDDMLRALIGLEPLIDAFASGEIAIRKRLGVIAPAPAVFARLFATLGGASVQPAGRLRVALVTESGQLGRSGRRSTAGTLDVPPALNRRACRGEPAAAFRAAMIDTLATSYAESRLGGDSAAAQLLGRPLVYVAPFASWTPPPRFAGATAAALGPLMSRYYNWHRFCAADGGVAALWIVDPATGSTTAIDAGGRGGAKFSSVSPMAGDDCRETDPDLWYWLDLAAAAISAACGVGGWQSPGFSAQMSGVAMYACVGATVEGVASLAYGSFSSPVKIGGVQWDVNLFGAVTGLAALGGAKTPFSGAGSAVQAVIYLMMSAIGLLGVPCLDDDPPPPPGTTPPLGPIGPPDPKQCSEPGPPSSLVCK